MGLAAEPPDFLGAEQDDADRPPRPSGLHDPVRRRGGDRDPAPLSIAPVPRSQLSRWPPIDDHARAGIAARHLGDDVAGLVRADVARREVSRIRTGCRGSGCAGAARRRDGERAGRDRPDARAQLCTPVWGLR
jgi:hypothetical protein